MKLLTALAVFALAGCGVEAKVEPGHISECRNTITGEDWTVHSENVRDAVFGFGGAPTCATMTTDSGRTMRLCDNDQVVKCWSVK